MNLWCGMEYTINIKVFKNGQTMVKTSWCWLINTLINWHKILFFYSWFSAPFFFFWDLLQDLGEILKIALDVFHKTGSQNTSSWIWFSNTQCLNVIHHRILRIDVKVIKSPFIFKINNLSQADFPRQYELPMHLWTGFPEWSVLIILLIILT